MDASFSLMSQYSTISARFPPPPAPTATTSQPTPEQSSATVNDPETLPSISKQTEAAPAASTSKDSDQTSPIASTSGIEPIRGHSPLLDDKNKPSTSRASVIDENSVTIEDLGRDDDNANDSDSTTELRRRRLQKFLKVEQDH